MPFIAAQFYPRFFTMIPAGLAVGLGGGPLWCAKCTYLTVVSEAYASVSDLSADILVTRFFGLFFMFYQLAQVWGNLISSAGTLYILSTQFMCLYKIKFELGLNQILDIFLFKFNLLTLFINFMNI